MKLSIFGATGRTGIPLIEQALERGHEVKALVRNPGKIKDLQSKITVIEGDAKDMQAVNKTIEGTEAVISVLGHAKNSPKNILEVSIKNIISSMQNQEIKRLAFLTGAGVRMPGDKPGFFDQFIVSLLKLLQGQLLKDSKAAVNSLQDSNLEYTIARAPMLTEKPGNKKYSVGMVGKGTGPKISRENAASYLLDAIEKSQNVKQSPMISDKG